MSQRSYPFELRPVPGCWTREHVANAVASLGDAGAGCAELAGRGRVPPDVMFAQTLMLLDGQRAVRSEPKPASEDGGGGAVAGGAVAGGVWVREQLTVHRPVAIDEPFRIEGEVARSYARRGRLYTVSTSRSFADDGRLLVSSCTTGLVRYRPDPALADAEHGVPDAEVRRAGPDPSDAANNPALAALRAARAGSGLEGPQRAVTLEMMRARDGGRSRNPIHTEPEIARREGLAAPIAGGLHVFAFAEALLLEAWGPGALLHGAHFDVRWRVPVHAGESVRPRARIARADEDRIEVELRVERDGVDAMLGRVTVPLPRAEPPS